MLFEQLNDHSKFEKAYSDKLKIAWQQILEERPQIENFLTQHGTSSLSAYSRSLITAPSSINPVAQNAILDLVGNLFDQSIVDQVKESISTNGSIDTSSHGGILSEDTLVQSQMVLASGVSSKKLPAMVSLACGVVPMNNATWPRGFFRLGKRESIFPKSFDRIAVYECQAFSKDLIKKKLSDKNIDSCTKEILELIDSTPSVYEQKKYSEQTSLINHQLWSKACSATGLQSFIHLQLEDLTSQLVINSIQSNDAFSELLFCVEAREDLFRILSGLPGTWTVDRSKGTFLFWHASQDFRAASLWPEDRKLVGTGITLEFSRDQIIESLKNKTIVPSVFTSLLSLLFYGVRPSGGYHQIAYLPEYARRINSFVSKNHVSSCPNFLGKISCADLIQLGYGFTFLQDSKSETQHAGIDTLLCEPISDSTFNALMNETTILQSVISNSRRWYNEVVPAAKRTIVL